MVVNEEMNRGMAKVKSRRQRRRQTKREVKQESRSQQNQRRTREEKSCFPGSSTGSLQKRGKSEGRAFLNSSSVLLRGNFEGKENGALMKRNILCVVLFVSPTIFSSAFLFHRLLQGLSLLLQILFQILLESHSPGLCCSHSQSSNDVPDSKHTLKFSSFQTRTFLRTLFVFLAISF